MKSYSFRNGKSLIILVPILEQHYQFMLIFKMFQNETKKDKHDGLETVIIVVSFTHCIYRNPRVTRNQTIYVTQILLASINVHQGLVIVR